MISKLFQKLKLSLEPVAICYTDELPVDTSRLLDGEGICVGTGLVAAAKGKSFFFCRDTYEGCGSGAIGIGFSNTVDEDFPVECLLSTGDEALAQLGKTSPFPFGKGERFFATPEIARRCLERIKEMEVVPYKYLIMKPFREVSQEERPASICVFVNPDQISALVSMSGFYTGNEESVVSPFGAACDSIARANLEGKKENPRAILGFFDISQRHYLPKDLLSYTMPYNFYEDMEKSVEKNCLTTEAWEELEKRQ